MKDKGREHRRGRSSEGFERHSFERGDDKVRRGRAWRFNSTGRDVDPFEPHFRVTARIAALPGKHMRSVREPDKAAHGKAL